MYILIRQHCWIVLCWIYIY